MPDEYIRLDTTIIAIDNLINEAATGTMARTLFKAKDTIYNQQRYVIDVQPVTVGRWKKDTMGYDVYIECSECGTSLSMSNYIEEEWRELMRYCPCCGARMDGDT